MEYLPHAADVWDNRRSLYCMGQMSQKIELLHEVGHLPMIGEIASGNTVLVEPQSSYFSCRSELS